MLKYGIETSATIHELLPQLESWWKQGGHYSKLGVRLKPDYDSLMALYVNGSICIIVGKDSEGVPRAIHICTISPYAFNKDVLIANTIVWWTDKDYRGRQTINDLLHATEEYCQALGVDLFNITIEHKNRKLALIDWLDSKGYTSREVSMTKVLYR